MSETYVRSVVVGSAAGLHARPAATVVRAAQGLPVKVMVCRPGGPRVPTSSILRVLGLHIEQGETVELSADGPDAQSAVVQLAELVERELDPQETQRT